MPSLPGRRCEVENYALPGPAVSGPEPRRYVSPQHVAEASGNHVKTLYRLIRLGKLTAYWSGRSLRLDAVEVSSVLRTVGPPMSVKAYVSHVVASAPPLAPEQLAHVASLLRPDGEASD